MTEKEASIIQYWKYDKWRDQDSCHCNAHSGIPTLGIVVVSAGVAQSSKGKETHCCKTVCSIAKGVKDKSSKINCVDRLAVTISVWIKFERINPVWAEFCSGDR